jgi:hypothetical protein
MRRRTLQAQLKATEVDAAYAQHHLGQAPGGGEEWLLERLHHAWDRINAIRRQLDQLRT